MIPKPTRFRGAVSALPVLALFSAIATVSATAEVLFQDDFNRDYAPNTLGSTSTGNHPWQSLTFDVTTAAASRYGISESGAFRIIGAGSPAGHDPGIAWVNYDLKDIPKYTYTFDFWFPLSTNNAASFLIIPRLGAQTIPGNAAFLLKTSAAPTETVPATYSVYDYRGTPFDGSAQMHIATTTLTNLTSSGPLPAKPFTTVPVHSATVAVDGDTATLTINGSLVGSIALLPTEAGTPRYMSFGYTPNAASNRALNLDIDNLVVSSVVPATGGFGAFMDGFQGLTAAEKLAGADPDGDGISNLLEYALDGLAPNVPNVLPTLANGSVTFTKRPLAVTNADVQYVIETSPTLGAAPSPWTAVMPTTNTSTAIGYTLPAGDQRSFLRLRVVRGQ